MSAENTEDYQISCETIVTHNNLFDLLKLELQFSYTDYKYECLYL